jgi:hypothetical protein
VEPLYGAVLIITANHLAVGNLRKKNCHIPKEENNFLLKMKKCYDSAAVFLHFTCWHRQYVGSLGSTGMSSTCYHENISLAVDHVTRGNLAVDHITRGSVAVDHITRGNLVADHTTRSSSAADHITRGNLAADHITRGNLAADHIARGSLAVDYITRGSLAVDHINLAADHGKKG